MCVCGEGGGKWKCMGNREDIVTQERKGQDTKDKMCQNTGEGDEQEPGQRPQFSLE